jgi:hypothetical protein
MVVAAIVRNVPLQPITKAVISTNAVWSKSIMRLVMTAMNFLAQKSSSSATILFGFTICQ